MKRLLYGLGIALVIFAGIYFGIAWYFSTQIIVLDAAPVDEGVAASPNEGSDEDYSDEARWRPPFDFPKEDISFEVNDITLAGWYYDNPADGNCGVVLLHGFTGDKGFVGLYAPMFYDLGCDILAYDSRGHGDSETAFVTWGYYERAEAAAAVEWLSLRMTLPTNQIGVLGMSYGASTALQMLFVQPDVAFVVVDSPFQDMETIIKQQSVSIFGDAIRLVTPGAFQVSEWRAGIEVDETSALKAVQNVDTPILIFHSTDDTFVYPSNSEAIYAVANPDTTRLILQEYGSSHTEAILTNETEMRQQVYAFIEEFAPDFGSREMIVQGN